MFQIAVFCLLMLQVVTAEPPPPKCRGPPPGLKNPKECCNFPNIFEEEDFKECGIEKPTDDVESMHRRGPPDCKKQICILEKYSLMKDDTNVDRDAVTAFMQKWADTNEDFKEAVDIAIQKCVTGDVRGPPEICEPTRMIFCIGSTMFMNCPKWEDTDNCNKVKEHIEECKPYFDN